MQTPPFHKLPEELIQSVLEEYVGSFEWSSLRFSEFLSEMLPLTWVCSRWRHLSLQTPSLWSHLYFDNASDLIPGFLDIVHVILERSQSHPLWMKIRRDDLMEFNLLFAVITLHMGRLHHLELDLLEIPMSPILQAIRDQSSQLQTLIIVDLAGGPVLDLENEEVSVPTLSHPNLRSMSLSMRWRVPQLPFRASDLDTLTLRIPAWAWDRLQTLLPLYPSIRHLRLDFNGTPMYEPDGYPIFVPSHGQFPTIPLPNLQTFQTDDPSICFDLEITTASVLHLQDGDSPSEHSTWLDFYHDLLRTSTLLPSAVRWRRLEAHWANIHTIRFSRINYEHRDITVALTASILACAAHVETVELTGCRGLWIILAALVAGAADSALESGKEPHERAAVCLPLLKKLVIIGRQANITTEMRELRTQRPALEIVSLRADGYGMDEAE
ncbi:hypothetical protein DL93DRAFT_2228016 [Clavulina sp. PMI_390]|nr:hypothetical protein DL93DRAFT_2228016 [Clavulina sp. PMI_390]